MIRKSLDDDVVFGEPIHLKYRPAKLKDVYGHDHVINSIQSMLRATARPHAFLFTGGSGLGKTSLARILAAEFDCNANNIIEVDAASHSGIDDMRNITVALQYSGFGTSPNKAVIVDECQGLSRQGWDTLLKSVEEPSPHVYFFFCSTNAAKVPKTIETRCQVYDLAPLKPDDIADLLEDVVKAEGYHTTPIIQDMVTRACGGSPRQALSMLAKVHDVHDTREAELLLAVAGENKDVIDLCRLMVSGNLDWPKLTATLKAMPEVNAEAIRVVVVAYLNSCLMGAKGDKATLRLLNMLECFIQPYNPVDKLAPILVAFGRFLYP